MYRWADLAPGWHTLRKISKSVLTHRPLFNNFTAKITNLNKVSKFGEGSEFSINIEGKHIALYSEREMLRMYKEKYPSSGDESLLKAIGEYHTKLVMQVPSKRSFYY